MLTSIVMLRYLQKLVKHGFMSAAELEACQVPKDPALPALAEGYVVSFTAFHECGSMYLRTCSSTRSYGTMASSFTT
jgi:hypothetical protein